MYRPRKQVSIRERVKLLTCLVCISPVQPVVVETQLPDRSCASLSDNQQNVQLHTLSSLPKSVAVKCKEKISNTGYLIC